MTIYGFAVFLIMLLPHFDKPKYHKIKGIMFLVLGISAGIAIMQARIFP